jgi:hypothetical protein
MECTLYAQSSSVGLSVWEKKKKKKKQGLKIQKSGDKVVLSSLGDSRAF